ncbi:MAG: AEC family transporter [Nocardioides sp.]|uniref:AEC family transporter n=1 Tax=Nocardioides sp. TaxID=35761 RepID=UPI0039E451DB
MQSVFEGFATVGLVIGLGILLAHLGVIDVDGQRVLSTLSFLVATPALLIVTIQGSELGAIFSRGMLASAIGVIVVVAGSVGLSIWRRETFGESVVGAMAASYGNTGNLGLPIAAYVLGSAVLVAPTMLLQLLFMQPVVLTCLDAAMSGRRLRVVDVVTRPFKNPITLGAFAGMFLVISDLTLPQWIYDPVELVGNLAVPCMLLAYGVALRLGPLPGRGVSPVVMWGRIVLKLVVEPVATYLAGRYVFGLDGVTLLAVTVIAALPTAQNTFVIASRYRTGQVMARDVIFVSTLLSVPVIAAVAYLLT